MVDTHEHFALVYAREVNKILHRFLPPLWCFQHVTYEIPDCAVSLFITYDDQREDEFIVRQGPEHKSEFVSRLDYVTHGEGEDTEENLDMWAQHPDRTVLGWSRRNIWFLKGGVHPQYWTAEHAMTDAMTLVIKSAALHGKVLSTQIQTINESLPTGRDHATAYEEHVRVVLNYLFYGPLGEATPQCRTEGLADDGIEKRDLLCHNLAESGFWRDLKDKYRSSEILFDAKNKLELTRDDLRQVYCYLKPALGFWGFIVCRDAQPAKVLNYNRRLFNNFAQTRGILIVTDDDLEKMVVLKCRGNDPTLYLQDLYSRFIRSV